MNLVDQHGNEIPQLEKRWVDTDQGFMDTNWDWGWWQQDLQPRRGGLNDTVEACVSALSQTVAMCPVHQFEMADDGEAVRRTGSNAEQVLLRPNEYTSRSQFFNSIIRSMYFSGDGYAVATRNNNGAINALYVMDPRNMNPVLDPESGELFYWASPNISNGYNPETDTIYMSRDVLHIRINVDPKNPLKGCTPITAAANSIAASSAITAHQAAFFNNMQRPSGVMSTPDKLTLEQMNQLSAAFAEKSKEQGSGRVPILGNGLTWQPMSLTSQDAQMVEAFGMTVQSISSVFRVPLPLINSMQGSTFNNAESMMSWFLASGLGFLLEHIELELDHLFGLSFKGHLNFETKALLRSDWKSQIETLSAGVLGGIYSPNEARAKIKLGPVEDGDEPRVQQQVVPLSAWDQSTPEPVPPVPDDVDAALSAGITKGLSNVG